MSHVQGQQSRHEFRPGLSGMCVELLKLAVEQGCDVGLRLTFREKELVGRVVLFDDMVGRVFLETPGKEGHIDGRGSVPGWVHSFLIREVHDYRFPPGLFAEWNRRKRDG